MIDTDKYEGHPPAPWGWRHKIAEWRLTANGDKEWIDGIRVNEDTDTTVMTLIADAPLLLEEVKELRAWKAEVERICRTMNGPSRDTALFIMTNEVEEE